jgi:hypothetical protein
MTRGTAPEFVAKINAFGGEEVILDRIADGTYMNALACEIGVATTSFYHWAFATPEREKLVKDAQRLAGTADAAKAEKILSDLPRDASPAEIVRARELASHWRWQAKMRDRATYGDQSELLVKTEVSGMTLDEIEAELAQLDALDAPPVTLQ